MDLALCEHCAGSGVEPSSLDPYAGVSLVACEHCSPRTIEKVSWIYSAGLLAATVISVSSLFLLTG